MLRFPRCGPDVYLLPLAVWSLVAVMTPVSPEAAENDRTSRYGQCMTLAGTDPQQALQTAKDWGDHGGGDAAGHCAAVALVGLKRCTEAAKWFEALAQNATPHPMTRAALLGQAGQAWLLGGDATKALDVLTRAVTLTPDDAALLVDRAQAKFDLQMYRDAITDLDAAVALNPRLVDAYVFRASAYRRLNELEQAKTDADKALSLDGLHPEALLERGIILRLRDDKIGARRDWLTLLTVAPDTDAARAAKANLDRMDAGIKFD